jgi:hypothetical protein
MINSIGIRKPKFFAVLDFTSGFFQAPLDESSSWYTAFITWFGLFEWIRVPMGLKGAPSWFQQQIAIKVLGGLLHTICELYIDDLIIYGETFEEFCENLEKVLQRLKEFGVTLNPEKAQLLMTEVQYVGFILDKEGIQFSEEKKSKALDFALPLTFKSLKKFVGLAETFHRHIPHFYDKARPLHTLLRGYNEMRNKNKPIAWTDENKQAFNDMQLAIGSAQKLHFVDDSKEVILQTDASDYGIGSALYQVGDDGEKIPIAFISKALVNEQLNWSVPEKEGYAIFYSLCKLEHLLRDVHFLLQTDHKNLTYINYGNSAKVLRWKLFVQEFDFSIEFLAGDENEVADWFSRGMENPKEIGTPQNLLNIFTDFHIPDEKYKLIAEVHNSTRGHFGVEKTMQKLIAGDNRWEHMREHIRAFIKKCPLCQKMSYIKTPIHTHPFVIGTYRIMERVAVDTIGPLPIDTAGNQYIITMIDCFSRYTLLVAAPDATARSAAKALLAWVSLFGVMAQLLSDMGTQYVNSTIDEMTELMGVEKLDTMPGIHEENSIVERRNSEAVRHLRAIVNHRKLKQSWSDVLPLAQRILNAEVMSSIGVSPAQILFGNSIDLDRGIFLSHDLKSGEELTNEKHITRYSEWMARMLKAQATIVDIAQQTQSKAHAEYFERFSKERTEFPVGSLVLVDYGDNRPTSKLHTYNRGPYRVVRNDELNKNRYTVQHLVTGKLEDFPNGHLKHYIWDEQCESPDIIAMQDEEYEIVEKIISHTPPKLHGVPKGKIFFNIKYVGEPTSKLPTKVPYENLRDNEILHDYLTKIKAVSLIPAKYKWGRDGPPTTD